MSLLLHIIVTYIKENIITKLQKLCSPPRNPRADKKSPALFVKKPLCTGDLLPACKIFIERPVLPCFFYFRKKCSHHHCHHFHLRFCWVISIGWGGAGEMSKIKHFWYGIGVKSSWGKPFALCHVNFVLSQSLFLPCFWKNREAAYFFPNRVALLARIFTNALL